MKRAWMVVIWVVLLRRQPGAESGKQVAPRPRDGEKRPEL